MPKEAIKMATLDFISLAKRQGRKGVWVPRARTHKPVWDKPKKTALGTWMPLSEVRDILVFALENAYIRLPDGTICHQGKGIPMGDPLSPGMTIATCAWMEREWMREVPSEQKQFFKAKRYMDDILMIYAENDRWEHQAFMAKFEI